MTKGLAAKAKASNEVLPTGGSFPAHNAREKTIDHPQALRQFKKHTVNPQSLGSDIFRPLEPTPSRQTHKGKDLHTDPFSENRAHYVPPAKVLLAHPHHDPHPSGIKQVKPLPHEFVPRNEVISANGVVFSGGKLMNQSRNDTTEQDNPKDFSKMARFRNSNERTNRDTTHIISHDPAANTPADADRHNVRHGKKNVVGHAGESLIGVLRPDAKKAVRKFSYRPPWGTCNTPRTTAPKDAAPPKVSPTPWATGANLA